MLSSSKTAVGYIRVSTEEQSREGISLDAQKAKIKAYCTVKDLDLVDIIEDAGISAKNLNRPGIQTVLLMARKKEVDAVIICKLDRMFRSTEDALQTTRKFDKWEISFHSIQETLDTKSAMGRFFFTLMSAIAQMEREIIGERTKAALSHKRAKGEKTGGSVPFGFDVDETGHLVENIVEQKAIRLIASLRRKGYSLRAICRELAKEGHRTKAGKDKWDPKSVSRILKRAA